MADVLTFTAQFIVLTGTDNRVYTDVTRANQQRALRIRPAAHTVRRTFAIHAHAQSQSPGSRLCCMLRLAYVHPLCQPQVPSGACSTAAFSCLVSGNGSIC